MKGKNFNKPGERALILVAPLDWGLGHATRSVPVIKALIARGCEVMLAADGRAGSLLQKEFPGLRLLYLKGYHMHYSRKGSWMSLILLLQLPKVLYRIWKEHAWLKKVIKEYPVDAVISDSRPGLYHTSVHSIYITHQLKIKTGGRFTEWLFQRFHYRFINRYNECWVPDYNEGVSLAGQLSHPGSLPSVPVKYTGPVSRFELFPAEKKYGLLIILSGPEPQRSILENILLKDLGQPGERVLLVRGLPEETSTLAAPSPDVEIVNHLPAPALNLAILQSGIIISRTGYTTVMDLIKLQKKAILIPTPGQTEQEYLSGHLSGMGLFLCIPQRLFSLSDALKKAAVFPFSKVALPGDHLEIQIGGFVQSLLR